MELHEYEARICVAGSRSFHDSLKFDAYLKVYVQWILSTGVKSIAFISGGAKRGADALIIEWARKNGYPCSVMEADWDKHGKSAGFIRNAEMRKVLTHLLAFWDGESSGTEEMAEATMNMEKADCSLIMVEPDAGWKDYLKRIADRKKKGYQSAWKQKGGRARTHQRA